MTAAALRQPFAAPPASELAPAGAVVGLVPELAAASELDAAAFAESTRRAYAGALARLERWLWRRGAAPLTDAVLAEYVEALYRAGAAPATVDQVVSAVGAGALMSGWESPVGAVTRRRVRAVHRLARDRGRGQVRGVDRRDAERMIGLAAAGGDTRGVRDAALLAVASDALLRVSEVVALDVADVAGALVIRASKTDPTGAGSVHHLGGATAGLVAWWRRLAGVESGALFRPLRGAAVSDTRLSAAAARKVIQRWARRAGVRGRVSGHSLRVGSAQSLAAAGATLVELQISGRWKSPRMPAHYARHQRAAFDPVARRIQEFKVPADAGEERLTCSEI